MDDETVAAALGKAGPPDMDALRKTFKKQKRVIRVDPSKYLCVAQEGANNYIGSPFISASCAAAILTFYIDFMHEEGRAYDERRHMWQYEDDESADLHFVERAHRHRRRLAGTHSSVATLAWAPDRENFNTIWMVIVKRDIPKGMSTLCCGVSN